jgi:subtilisin family serine protease
VVYASEDVPLDSEDAIRAAGGKVVNSLPLLGIVVASSANPSFADDLGKNASVLGVGFDVEITLDIPFVQEVAEADIPVGDIPVGDTPVGDIPVGVLKGPGDLYRRLQWDIKKVTENGQSFGVQTGNKKVVVGVIDTGIDFGHPDLKDNIVPGSKTFVPGTTDARDMHGHGTHVSGAIAANGRIYGVGPNLGIRAYRVFGATGGARSSWIMQAIVAAADDGVDVINMSLGGYRLLGYRDNVADKVAYQRTIRYAIKKGVTVVAAAGNDALDLDNRNLINRWLQAKYPQYNLKNGAAVQVPGGLPGVITVSASTSRDTLAFYSNYGSSVIAVTAPGGDLGPNFPPVRDITHLCLSAYPTYLWRSGYAWMAGTSMASPKVAGVAALIIAQYGKIGPAQVEERLRQTAVSIGPVDQDQYFGDGLVNALNAVSGR